jgi:hypothetical protein
MGEMRIMSPLDGDKHIEWDPEDQKSVAKAKKKFEELLEKGFHAFKVSRKPQRTGQEVKSFNPDVGEYILAPAMQGG